MVVLAGTLGSCADHGPTAPGANGEVALHLGDSARLSGPAAFVTFARLDEDSRCPMGAMCFIAGQAVIELSMTNGKQTEVVPLTLVGMEGDSETSAPTVSALGHTFKLFRLDPYPQINQPRLVIRPLATVFVDSR